MKPLIVYHDHCTDGFAAAFCAWKVFGDLAEYRPMSYGFQQDKIPDYQDREVYILDFSWPKPWMDNLLLNAKRVVWLDHHKSAFEMWCETEREKHISLYPLPNDHIIVLDNSKSGAMLAWEHFFPDQEAPDFIKWVDDRDRWQFKLQDSKSFHTGMTTVKPWTFEQWDNIFFKDRVTGPDEIIAAGDVILQYAQQQINNLVKYAVPCTIDITVCDGPPLLLTGLAVNSSLHMSEVGHELANKNSTYGLIWYLGENGRVKVSLRSNGDYDVSSIAKQFGGGGHRNAAGFETDVTTLMNWLK